LTLLSNKIPDLKSEHEKCKKQIEKFSDSLKESICENEKFETFLRSKINAV